MNKLASAGEWQPAEMFGMAAAGGAGGFGAIRLLTEILNKAQGRKTPEAQKAVQLMLQNPQQPAPHGMPGTQEELTEQGHHDQMPYSSPKTAKWQVTPAADGEPGFASSILPLVAGLPAGFLGAKWMYDKHKGGQLDKQTEQAKQQYLQELHAAQSQMKMSSFTPRVDSVCEAVADELNAGR